MGLVTIVYCLRFETCLFVASYDSQGYGGGIRPRLHTGCLMTVKKKYTYREGVERERSSERANRSTENSVKNTDP
jgi:hypothetical protein